jgi:hypothetical protein
MSARDELMLDSMGPSPEGGFEIKTHAGGPETAETLLFIADSMRSMLDEHDAPNYLEMEVKASDGKNYIMILQRRGKITPHAARLAAEEALEASKPRTVTTAAQLEALPFGSAVQTSDESDTVVLRCEGNNFRNQSGADLSATDLWRYGTHPFTVLYSPEASA